MEDIKNLRVDEKTRADTLTKCIQECVARVEKLEKEKQTKLCYAIPKVDIFNWSLFQTNHIKHMA